MDLDAQHDCVDKQLRGVGGHGRDDAGDHGHREEADGDGRAGVPHESKHPGQRGRGAPDRLLEVAPATTQVLRSLRRLRLLDHRVAGQAAVCRADIGRLGAPPAPHPPHRRTAVPRRHHSHGATLPHGGAAIGFRTGCGSGLVQHGDRFDFDQETGFGQGLHADQCRRRQGSCGENGGPCFAK